MRSKVTIVLLFLNVVLFFYIFQYEEKWRAEAKTLEARRRVLGPEAASIDSLERTSRTGSPLRLVKRGEAWWLTAPYEWPAEPNALNRLVTELQFLEHETSFAVADLAKSGQTLADYGLAEPAFTLTFTAAGKSYPLQIGDDTKIGNRLYVLSPDGKRIHVVGRSLADSVGLPLESLRAPAIFSVPVFEVRSLNIQAGVTSNLKVRLRRDSASHWSFEAPINARASRSNVEVTINALNALTAKNFLEAVNPRLEKAGLEAPTLSVTLEGNARRETLQLGNPTGTPVVVVNGVPQVEYFARIEDKAAAFTTTVPQPLLDVLRAALEALREPRVLDFEPGTVTALAVTAPGQPELSLQRLEVATGASAGWQVVTRIAGQAPLTTTADSQGVEELLQKIHQLAAQEITPGLPKFVSDAPSAADLENWGFNRPEREVTLSLSTGGGIRGNEPSTLTLQIGVSPDRPGVAFARVTNAPFVYQILPDLIAETPTLARHYRQRLLRDLPEGARITGLTLTEIATGATLLGQQIAEGDKNWDAALANEPENRRRAVATLLAQLHTLRARRFTTDTFDPAQADTPTGPRPWKYRLEATLSFPGASAAAPISSSTLHLTDRLGGSTLLAGTSEFGGVVFETTQELLDAVFALTYAEKNDPGPAEPTASVAVPPAATPAVPETAPAKKP